MKIAIVGSSRLTIEERDEVIHQVGLIVDKHPNSKFITGDAEGVDKVVRVMLKPEFDVTVFEAKDKNWEGNDGFKDRNIRIAHQADIVYSIATKKIKDKRCYHCDEQDHDRTGGCWTKRYAMDKLHKEGETIII